MKLEQILSEWEKDSVIDHTNLARESLNIPKLHHKYYRIFVEERLRLRQLEEQYNTTYQLLFDWMDGKLSREELAAHNLEPYMVKRLKSEIEKRIPHEPMMADLARKLAIQRDKIELLESVIKTFTNRGFQIKNAIDFIKFQNGT